MGLLHLFILVPRIHKIPDIHLFKSSLTAKKRQQIAACITGNGHQDTPPIKFNPQIVAVLEHGIQHCHDQLLQQNAQRCPGKECTGPHNDIFTHIQTGDLLLFHSEK